MATVILPDNGQTFPVPDDIAADDEQLKSVLRAVYPEIGDPTITRTTKDSVLTVTVVKQAGRKGVASQATQERDTVPGMDSAALDIDNIRTDGNTQARVQMNEETIGEYAREMEEGAVFPPVVVIQEGTTYWLADGFHRLEALRRTGQEHVKVLLRRGTQRDAILYAITANNTHGLRRTNADKRLAVEWMLEDAEWGKWSDREIARKIGVSNALVSTMRGELSVSERQMPETRTVRRGDTTYEFTPAPAPAKEETGEDEDEDEAEVQQKCRVCGCTDGNGCSPSCTWVEDDLCSSCVEAEVTPQEAKSLPQGDGALLYDSEWTGDELEKHRKADPETARIAAMMTAPPVPVVEEKPQPEQKQQPAPASKPTPKPAPTPAPVQPSLPIAKKAASYLDAQVTLTIKLMPQGPAMADRVVMLIGAADGISPVVMPVTSLSGLGPLPEALVTLLGRIEEQYE